MITLYGSGSYFGLPDPSPFVTKVEVLLKMAKLPYRTAEMSFRQAPKGKIPYIEDNGRLIADSHFIRRHIETTYHVDFTGGYSDEKLAVAWSLERLLEEHLYWLVVHDRWAVDSNFDKGPRQFFLKAPAPVRPFVVPLIRRQVRKALHAQGLGRHTAAERAELGRGDLDAVSTILGSNRYLLGDRPCAADATLYSFMLGTLCPLFDSDHRQYAESKPNITAYIGRMGEQYHSDNATAAA